MRQIIDASPLEKQSNLDDKITHVKCKIDAIEEIVRNSKFAERWKSFKARMNSVIDDIEKCKQLNGRAQKE